MKFVAKSSRSRLSHAANRRAQIPAMPYIVRDWIGCQPGID
jgi:hypothetical protein